MDSAKVQRDSLQPEAYSLKPVFADRLGTVRARGVGAGLTRSNYYPFGEEIGGATANNTYKFASTYRDSSSGLDYAVNRYYASGMGRFTTGDPYRASAGPSDPQSWNRYSYAQNDPLNYWDPMGRDMQVVETGLWPCGPGWATDASLAGPCDAFIGVGTGGGGPAMNVDLIAAALAAIAATATAPATPPKRYAAGLKKAEDCYYDNGYLAWVGYVRVVTYQVVDQFGDPFSGATVRESVKTTSGPEIEGNGVWGPSNGEMRPNGTFEDLYSSDGHPASTVEQSYYSHGIELTVEGLGKPTKTLSNLYAPHGVSINGTVTTTPCKK